MLLQGMTFLSSLYTCCYNIDGLIHCFRTNSEPYLRRISPSLQADKLITFYFSLSSVFPQLAVPQFKLLHHGTV